MKKLLILLPLVLVAAACDDFGLPGNKDSQGELRWVLDRDILTKAGEEIPDTNDFILTVRDASGTVLYEGNYGDSPEVMKTDPGSYTVSIVSIPFTSPAFARPQYGDEQVVVVPAGKSVTVKLRCTLQNAGIRLKIASDFLTSFPDGVLYVSQGSVKLKYQYSEKRIAYVKPGEVNVLLYNFGQFETLLTRSVQAKEILSIQLSAPSKEAARSSISVQLDTGKVWISDSFVIGGGGGSGSSSGDPGGAISVGDVPSHVGQSDVWVYGYIVGGDLTSAGNTVKTSGVSKNTHIALADRSSVTSKSSCLAVELPKGKVRDALNLVDHPDLVGCRVYVKGTLVESYFSTNGMKGTNDFVLK